MGGDNEDEDLGRSSLSLVIQIPRALLQRFSGWNPPVQRAGHPKGHDRVPCSPATHGPLLPSQGTVWKQGRRAEQLGRVPQGQLCLRRLRMLPESGADENSHLQA